jgi:pimeloyl-ACP methyl ester carboxylesterase
LPEDHSAIKEMFPKARIEAIAGAEHWVHSQKPKEFLQLAVNFINGS